MSAVEKSHIINALSFELDHCDEPIVYERMVQRFSDISLDLAQAVAEKVGGPIPTKEGRPNHGKSSKGLSQFEFTPENMGLPPTIESRMIAIIIADGFNLSEYEAVKGALTAAGALPFTIGPKRQPVKSSSGKSVSPDHHFEGMRSTMFDSLYIPGGKHVSTLLTQGRVVHWVREAFGHCKPIGGSGRFFTSILLSFASIKALSWFIFIFKAVSPYFTCFGDQKVVLYSRNISHHSCRRSILTLRFCR